MTAAWLFPGQGLLVPAMGLALAEREPAARQLLELAGDLLGLDVHRLLSRGGRALERTETLQPIVTAVSLGAWESMRRRAPAPAFVAGHSLGEIAAWAATGAIGATEAVRLAARRGELMGEAARTYPGGMLCLLTEEADVAPALALGAAHGAVILAGANTPHEWVLSGDHAALDAVAARYTSRRIAVAGAWHSPAMAAAAATFGRELASLSLAEAATPMLSNRDGQVADPAALPCLLAEQLTSPVRFTDLLATLEAAGVSHAVTLGPGRVLRGLLRANLWTRVVVLTTENPDDLDRSAAVLKGDP